MILLHSLIVRAKIKANALILSNIFDHRSQATMSNMIERYMMHLFAEKPMEATVMVGLAEGAETFFLSNDMKTTKSRFNFYKYLYYLYILIFKAIFRWE